MLTYIAQGGISRQRRLPGLLHDIRPTTGARQRRVVGAFSLRVVGDLGVIRIAQLLHFRLDVTVGLRQQAAAVSCVARPRYLSWWVDAAAVVQVTL